MIREFPPWVYLMHGDMRCEKCNLQETAGLLLPLNMVWGGLEDGIWWDERKDSFDAECLQPWKLSNDAADPKGNPSSSYDSRYVQRFEGIYGLRRRGKGR